MNAIPVSSAARQRVLLFSGHMVDAPNRATPRFPPALEPDVRLAICGELDAVRAGTHDIAISSGACGGDILFAEAVLERSVQAHIYLPFDEPTFIEKSVRFANEQWLERYRAVVAKSRVLIAPETLGPLAEGIDPFERTNLWMLDEALRIGGEHIVFICLWDGKGGDGPGGTQHMMSAARKKGGEVRWIDIGALS